MMGGGEALLCSEHSKRPPSIWLGSRELNLHRVAQASLNCLGTRGGTGPAGTQSLGEPRRLFPKVSLEAGGPQQPKGLVLTPGIHPVPGKEVTLWICLRERFFINTARVLGFWLKKKQYETHL